MERNYTLDNAKFLMILLVVYGHMIEPLIWQYASLKSLFLSIYSFHVPVFVIISGMLTSAKDTPGKTARLFASLSAPIIVFTVLYELACIITQGAVSNEFKHFVPYRVMWFLWSLFAWRLFLPVIMKCRFPLLTVTGIALLAGYFTVFGTFLSIARTLYFFPFFVLGHKMGSGALSAGVLKKIPKIVWVAVLAGNVIICANLHTISTRWFSGYSSYFRLGVSDVEGTLLRIAIYGFSLVSAMAVLYLVPDRKLRISAYGVHSLYAFLWHYFFVMILDDLGLIAMIGKTSDMFALAMLLVVSIALTVALSSGTVARVTRQKLLNPVTNLLIKPEPPVVSR